MKDKKTFQEQFKALQKIVEEFEKGNLDLDASLAKFEEGLALAAECKTYLNDVENKVLEIKKKFDTLMSNNEQVKSSDEIPF